MKFDVILYQVIITLNKEQYKVLLEYDDLGFDYPTFKYIISPDWGPHLVQGFCYRVDPMEFEKSKIEFSDWFNSLPSICKKAQQEEEDAE